MIRQVLIFSLLCEFIFCLNIDEIILCDCHSHNDYLNEAPLFNALNHGFKSIEVDIILYKESLYVAHHRWQKRKNKVIEKLYLDTLYKIFLDNNGYIYKNDNSLYLLVDIKTSANDTYIVLDKLLRNYKPMLSRVVNDSVIYGAVTIILSGNKPKIEYLSNIEERYVFIDGRLSDIGKNIPNSLMPLVSIDWTDKFNWVGIGNLPVEELITLNEIIFDVHSEGKKLRFWGSPDNEQTWQILFSSGVDLINTDKILKLYNFMKKQ